MLGTTPGSSPTKPMKLRLTEGRVGRLGRPDGPADLLRGGLDERLVRRDGDGLVGAPDFEADLELLLLAHVELDVLLERPLEPGGLDHDAVEAGRERGEDVLAVPAGRRRAPVEARLLVGDGDLRAGHGGAVRVEHRAPQRRRAFLRRGSERARQEQARRREEVDASDVIEPSEHGLLLSLRGRFRRAGLVGANPSWRMRRATPAVRHRGYTPGRPAGP